MSIGEARVHTRLGRVWLAAALAALVLHPGRLRAAEPAVGLGEVATRVSRANVDLAAVVRRAFERELALLALDTPRERYVLSASLVRLDGKIMSGGGQVECIISAVLREKKSGAIHAIIEGRAKAEGDVSGSPAAERSAIEAAVRGAVNGLPQAVR